MGPHLCTALQKGTTLENFVWMQPTCVASQTNMLMCTSWVHYFIRPWRRLAEQRAGDRNVTWLLYPYNLWLLLVRITRWPQQNQTNLRQYIQRSGSVQIKTLYSFKSVCLCFDHVTCLPLFIKKNQHPEVFFTVNKHSKIENRVNYPPPDHFTTLSTLNC